MNRPNRSEFRSNPVEGVSLRAYSQRTGLSVSEIRYLIDKGEIPSYIEYEGNRRLRFIALDVEGFPVELRRDLTVAEYARIQGVSQSTVRRAIKRGEIATYTSGGKKRLFIPVVGDTPLEPPKQNPSDIPEPPPSQQPEDEQDSRYIWGDIDSIDKQYVRLPYGVETVDEALQYGNPIPVTWYVLRDRTTGRYHVIVEGSM